MKASFYEEMERVFDTFPKYHMKILLVGMEDIFKPKIWNESLYEALRIVNFATSKNLTVQCSHTVILINLLGRLQMGKPTMRITTF
jgi:hypothetical protein